jgi:hypothetical protein
VGIEPEMPPEMPPVIPPEIVDTTLETEEAIPQQDEVLPEPDGETTQAEPEGEQR